MSEMNGGSFSGSGGTASVASSHDGGSIDVSRAAVHSVLGSDALGRVVLGREMLGRAVLGREVAEEGLDSVQGNGRMVSPVKLIVGPASAPSSSSSSRSSSLEGGVMLNMLTRCEAASPDTIRIREEEEVDGCTRCTVRWRWRNTELRHRHGKEVAALHASWQLDAG